jgi:hypothetical protein
MLLLPDGTVMAANAYTADGGYGHAWYRLTPDDQGHYVNGTWTPRASATYTRLWCSTAVLRDGRVFAAGGEYGTGGRTAEVYDTVNDSWTTLPVPAGLLSTQASGDGENNGFRDSICKVLPNFTVMIAPVFPYVANGTIIFDPSANTFSPGQPYLGSQNEASWVKLPDDSILTIDKNSEKTERFIPSLNQWINDANTPVNLYDPYGDELGAGFLLPNGKAFFLGSSGHTAIYTPAGTMNVGSWVQGPDIPGGRGTPDAGAAMLPNGKILCVASPSPVSTNEFPAPISFFEYDYTSGSVGAFTQIPGPTDLTDGIPSYQALFLVLPDGNVLYSRFGRQLYVYQPGGTFLAAGKPTIYSLTQNLDGSYHLTGTLFNGISEGASYGDDAQMDSNYPLVRLVDGAGNAYYARTYNWSSSGVMTGGRTVSTEFTLPANLPAGSYSLVVVANGIASDPVTFPRPVWVDFDYAGSLQTGDFLYPYPTMAQGVSAVPSGGTILIKAPGSSPETITISKPMTVRAVGGTVTIGQ